MSVDLLAEWHDAFAEWLAAQAAAKHAAATLPPRECQPLEDTEYAAWSALIEAPAPTWSEAAWKVRQLLTPEGAFNTAPGWSAETVEPLLADIDRLVGIPGQQSGTAREFQSPAAPDQHKSEEIIVADTANSTAVLQPEGITPIRQLALMRQTALDRGERPVSNRDDEADRHWDRQFEALGIAIASEPPRNLVDAVTVLECVSGMHDTLNHSDMTEGDHVRFFDTVGAAINHCLPIIASALAPEDLTEGQHGHIAWAAAASARRENPNG